MEIVFRRYCTLDNTILVVFSFYNGSFLFYDGISANILYLWLSNETNQVYDLLKANNIEQEEFETFIADFNMQLKETIQITEEGTSREKIAEDNEIFEELYQAGFLYSFHIDITSNCNFRCKHCYHTFDLYDKCDVSIESIKKLFDDLNQLGVFKITLSGGEPLTNPHIWEILEIGKEYPFVFEIYSNGFLIDESTIDKMKRYPIGLLSFSFYGQNKATSIITGNDLAYSKLMNAIDLCQKKDMCFELKYIILKSNISDISWAREFCDSKKISLSFELCITPKIDGDMTNLSEKITPDEYMEILQKNADIMLYPSNNYNDTSILGCNAGRFGLYSDYSGNVFPCVSWRKHLGHVENIKSIWESLLKEKFLYQKKCIDYPSFNKNTFCKYCYQLCPGLSLLERGTDEDCYNSGCEISKIVEKISTSQ